MAGPSLSRMNLKKVVRCSVFLLLASFWSCSFVFSAPDGVRAEPTCEKARECSVVTYYLPRYLPFTARLWVEHPFQNLSLALQILNYPWRCIHVSDLVLVQVTANQMHRGSNGFSLWRTCHKPTLIEARDWWLNFLSYKGTLHALII